MTRFFHDQFAKQYLEELLSTIGEVKAPREVRGETRQIDVWFSPRSQLQGNLEALGLLGRFATIPALFEPFRNPATPDEIINCMLKLWEVRGELQREAKRKQTQLRSADYPKLWILTPTASQTILSGFGAISDEQNWLPGIYFMADYLRTAIVVIHQLPCTPETLWLRILGRGRVQSTAIDELEALPADNLFRSNALLLLADLLSNIEVNQNLESEDRELIMRLSPLFSQRLEEATKQGMQQGMQQGIREERREQIENILKVRFGTIDNQLEAIIEPSLSLLPAELVPLLLQLSRDELLARFVGQNGTQN
ncbi:MAG: hypothetical protein F6K18_23985 [Okeania sp. SIO2C2]|uniref:hypothetical protein n=1 Tax=Okeania sp. SIO2C2 TaxID=2607787 RepID=UPI0013BE636E|nr:hypothetical protein [Okeania sp. SIO2C2]NEP89646.1 hypothetical protein [Okeania sp. SIO2C2]